MKNLVTESLTDYQEKREEIAELKQKIMYAQMFHPEKVDIYIARLKEIEGDLPANTIDEGFGDHSQSDIDEFIEKYRPSYTSDEAMADSLQRRVDHLQDYPDDNELQINFFKAMIKILRKDTPKPKKRRQKWTADDKATRVRSFSGGYEKSSWRGENPSNK